MAEPKFDLLASDQMQEQSPAICTASPSRGGQNSCSTFRPYRHSLEGMYAANHRARPSATLTKYTVFTTDEMLEDFSCCQNIRV